MFLVCSGRNRTGSLHPRHQIPNRIEIREKYPTLPSMKGVHAQQPENRKADDVVGLSRLDKAIGGPLCRRVLVTSSAPGVARSGTSHRPRHLKRSHVLWPAGLRPEATGVSIARVRRAASRFAGDANRRLIHSGRVQLRCACEFAGVRRRIVGCCGCCRPAMAG